MPAAGATAIALASENWPASSTNSTSTASSSSSRDHSQAVPPTTSTSPACERRAGLGVARVAGRGRARRRSSSCRVLLARSGPARRAWRAASVDLVERVADHLVAVRGDADLRPARGRAPRSSGPRCTSCRCPGGPWIGSVAVVEGESRGASRPRAASRRPCRSGGCRATAGRGGRRRSRSRAAPKPAASRRCPCVEHPRADPRERSRCSSVSTNSHRDQRLAARPVACWLGVRLSVTVSPTSSIA